MRTKKKIGTGNLRCHRNPDFDNELKKKYSLKFRFLKLR